MQSHIDHNPGQQRGEGALPAQHRLSAFVGGWGRLFFSAADAGDWAAIQALLATARERYAQFPWALEVIESLAELASPENILRFKKEALYSSRKMSTRLSDKEALSALLQEDAKASYLRRKKLQGKAQFDMPDNSTPSK
ncbi:MAG: hypothetical protein KIT07_00815 [Anaerolineales bacterium]|nr:hypothetical protein [Anaerolineales bacterium]